MTGEMVLPKLEGTNPLGFLAALGVMSCLDRAGRATTLRWTEGLVPTAVVSGAAGIDELVALVDRDRQWWAAESVTLGWRDLEDLKLAPSQLREWAKAIRDAWRSDSGNRWRRDDAELWCALVAEGAIAQKGDAKPTHLYFTAGQQRFLDMARRLASAVDVERVREAIEGPWRFDSDLPSFGWNASGDRPYALGSSDPSKAARLGIPGADWLAFLGLKFLPVAAGAPGRSGRRPLRTTGCDDDWKAGTFRWPLWLPPATPRAVAGLIGDMDVVGSESSAARRGRTRRRRTPRVMAERGVSVVLESPIRRTDQGGYGSFGAPTAIVDTGHFS